MKRRLLLTLITMMFLSKLASASDLADLYYHDHYAAIIDQVGHAKTADAEAMRYMGLALRDTRHLDEAILWLEKSAKAGDRLAQYSVASLYFGQRDFAAARIWYEAAAAQDDGDAEYQLGLMYEYGYGVSPDYKKSVAWYASAAERGHAQAIEALPISCKTAPH